LILIQKWRFGLEPFNDDFARAAKLAADEAVFFA
jgi:hypothetical protein